jgi:hypothetical protein
MNILRLEKKQRPWFMQPTLEIYYYVCMYELRADLIRPARWRMSFGDSNIEIIPECFI